MSFKSVFIVWARHSRRAETLATELDGRVSLQYEAGLKGLWLTPLRYLLQSWKTWHFLEREQPEAVLVQSPPIFAPLLVATWCKLRSKTGSSGHKTSYAIDCHTSTFHHTRWRWALPLLRILSKNAAVTLVTDEEALHMMYSWKAKCIFLIDGLPSLNSATSTIGSEGEVRVAFICTFDKVEPVAEVFAAARLLPHVTFYVTGDPKQATTKLLAQKPTNVILTGFLHDGVYTGLLKNVHGLLILTKRRHDLSCGAYEALAIEKPAVVSDWPGLRSSFTRGFIYVINTPEAIAAGIKSMLSEQAMLTNEIIAMRSELVARRQPMLEELAVLLNSSRSDSWRCTYARRNRRTRRKRSTKEDY